MTAPASRRGLILGLAALPLVGGAAVASRPSELASACDWAVGQRDWINEASDLEDWDDPKLDAECERHEAVIIRAIEEPSKAPGDLAAKARLLLQDLMAGGTGQSPYNDDKLTLVVLREVIALCA